MSSVSFKVEINDEEFSRLLEDTLEDDERFQPYSVTVDSDHAGYIEYGSPPLLDREKYTPPKTRSKGTNSELFENLKKWYKARNGGVWSNEDVYLIYRKIMEKGTPPQPFIRPALYDLTREIQDGQSINGEMSFEALANWLKDRMIYYLEENHTIYEGGTLKDKIFVEKSTDGKVGDLHPFDEGIRDVDSQVYGDYKGDPTDAMERRKHLGDLRWK